MSVWGRLLIYGGIAVIWTFVMLPFFVGRGDRHSDKGNPRTRWERWHPIRAGRLWRCIAHDTHDPVLVDMGRRKMCWTCCEWTEEGRW